MAEDLPPPDKDLESKASRRDPRRDFLDWQREGGAYEQWRTSRPAARESSWIDVVIGCAVFIIIVVVVVILIRVLT